MTLPKLSLLIIVYNMAEQAMNTIHSLSASYQQNVSEQDYEIIIIENKSCNNNYNLLNEKDILKVAPNSRYFLREEAGVSPVHAINFGFEKCRAPMIGLMIDGARMLSPRVLEYALMAQRIDKQALIAVPGYNLGPSEHHFAHKHNYHKADEKLALEKIDWKNNGYRLFDISSLGGANPNGVINPLLESNCLFAAKTSFEKIGWANTQFTYLGGGSLNLHIFRSLGMLTESARYFVLLGEGSFHQLHGGATTRDNNQQKEQERELMLKKFAKQLNEMWGEFIILKREPILLGAVTVHAQKNLTASCQKATIRFNRFNKENTQYWIDDVNRLKKDDA